MYKYCMNLLCLCSWLMQLTRENHQQAISQLLDVIEQAENSTVEQNDEVLRRVALYFSQMSTFVKNTDVAVEPTVSVARAS